jgi:polyisoprenoid-binding protein YceI
VRSLLKVVAGVGVPLALVVLLIQAVGWRPAPPAERATLDAPAQRTGDDAVELVGAADGTWVLDDDAASFLGYRITEHYPRIRRPAEATGRTPEVEADLRLEDATITDARVVADLTALASDGQNRDRALESRYLETRSHPEATFALTEPAPIRPRPEPGRPFTVTVRGDLVVRGVARPVALPLEGRWDGDVVQVVGRLPVRLSDWAIDVPDIAGFVRVEDEAEIEVDLTFVRG